MTRWEYKVVTFGDLVGMVSGDRVPSIGDGLNQLGAEGWELVGTTVAATQVYYFKRPVADG